MSQVPIFFHDGPLAIGDMDLQTDTAKHVVQVLRMSAGSEIALTNGKGERADGTILSAQKKSCVVNIAHVQQYERKHPLLYLAVAFTKNTARNEWILEKATELGVATIIPLSAARSVREKFRYDRWQNILVAAIIQSQQYYLPELRELAKLDDLVEEMKSVPQKLVAHCMDDISRKPILDAIEKDKETLLLIGPEGDFTIEEVNDLTSKGYTGISMGVNRLRTETAAVNACACFNMVNHG